jgi:hypothetical protein
LVSQHARNNKHGNTLFTTKRIGPRSLDPRCAHYPMW